MKLTELKLQNFRGYKNEISVTFEDLTVLVGRNDAGKSTLLDALNVFFNDAPIEKDDACVHGDASNVRITCVFSDLPKEIVLDEQHTTSLQKEYLVRQDGQLEICRVFNCTLAKGKQSAIFTKAYHPTAVGCADLMTLKIKDLKSRATQREVNLEGVNQTIKTALRQAIWLQTDNVGLADAEVDLSAETGKTAWDQIQLHLPVYALFKSDRTSTDQDEEAQDPMKAAIKETLKGHESQLNTIIDQVKAELERVAKKTVEKIQEMSPELAKTLNPQVKNKNWDSLFSVSLSGDDGISINKRGSGTRRLVLINFFRAKAEDASTTKKTGTIYAVEEPETSQHPNHQLMLLDAFHDLTSQGQCQVILTTHTPTLARKVDRRFLRMIRLDAGHPNVFYGKDDATLESIKATLGVLADHDVKVFLGVEGKWDIEFLKRISKLINSNDPTVPDLERAEASGKLLFIPLGGSSMELWANRIAGLDRPEFYVTDRDNAPPANPKYFDHHTDWNARNNCTAYCTNKRELENYLHPDCIRAIEPSFPPTIADFDDVPLMLAEALHSADANAPAWDTVTIEKRKQKASRAKRRLNTECADKMTLQLLSQSDPNGEISSWLKAMGSKLV
ncbi:MAG: putative ATP-dependent endonuclease of the family [Verrucomicrobiales bacterium]|nr:putative ATP-dependent endonuclease of the family [Verrucomicrobiales bacterium]